MAEAEEEQPTLAELEAKWHDVLYAAPATALNGYAVRGPVWLEGHHGLSRQRQGTAARDVRQQEAEELEAPGAGSDEERGVVRTWRTSSSCREPNR